MRTADSDVGKQQLVFSARNYLMELPSWEYHRYALSPIFYISLSSSSANTLSPNTPRGSVSRYLILVIRGGAG
jgi:hypothetical protein